MAIEETSVKVRVVTMGGTLIGTMTKAKNIRTFDALNLKSDFFALTEAKKEGETQSRPAFMAVKRRQVIYVEEIP